MGMGDVHSFKECSAFYYMMHEKKLILKISQTVINNIIRLFLSRFKGIIKHLIPPCDADYPLLTIMTKPQPLL